MNTQNPTPSRALVVSIHDVSPMTLEPVKAIVGELETAGVPRTSLLVVPDHHHRGHFLNDKKFCDWLLARHRDGHEIVIHGYYHLRERKKSETLWQKLMTRAYTADEGEFYDISAEQALALVVKAQEDFAKLGLNPPGFIAPAWLLSDAGVKGLREAGIHYTTRIGGVLDLETGLRNDSQSLVYSVRNGWRRAASLAWNASLFSRLWANPLLRVSIHPVDLAHAAIWRQIRKYIALALEDRTPMTYWDWLSAPLRFNSQSRNHVES